MVPGYRISGAQFRHRAERDHNQAGRRPLDRQAGTADKGTDQSSDDGGEQARCRRHPAGNGNPQAQGQGNEKHKEPGSQIGHGVSITVMPAAAPSREDANVPPESSGCSRLWSVPPVL